MHACQECVVNLTHGVYACFMTLLPYCVYTVFKELFRFVGKGIHSSDIVMHMQSSINLEILSLDTGIQPKRLFKNVSNYMTLGRT